MTLIHFYLMKIHKKKKKKKESRYKILRSPFIRKRKKKIHKKMLHFEDHFSHLITRLQIQSSNLKITNKKPQNNSNIQYPHKQTKYLQTPFFFHRNMKHSKETRGFSSDSLLPCCCSKTSPFPSSSFLLL